MPVAQGTRRAHAFALLIAISFSISIGVGMAQEGPVATTQSDVSGTCNAIFHVGSTLD
jgi:hypothetical protein